MKKLISMALIFTLLPYLIGCYSMREVTKEEFISQQENDKALLITKYNKAYQFSDKKYTIKSDTLLGKGLRLSGNNETPFSGKIALDDVMTYNLEKLNVEVVFLVLIPIIVLVAIAASELNSDWAKGMKMNL